MCRWKPTVTQIQQIGEADEEVDWETYCDKDDQGTGDSNAIKEEDEIVETLEEGLEGNDFSKISHEDAKCNMIQTGDHDPEDAFDLKADMDTRDILTRLMAQTYYRLGRLFKL